MSWSIGYDDSWKRDIGYDVPSICDQPECNAEIDRGLSHVCGGEPYGGEGGCGLYFCSEHLYYSRSGAVRQQCFKCGVEPGDPYTPKPDTPEWINHKLTDESWQEWRDAYPEKVAALRGQLPQDATHE